jgi:hypothetical protein
VLKCTEKNESKRKREFGKRGRMGRSEWLLESRGWEAVSVGSKSKWVALAKVQVQVQMQVQVQARGGWTGGLADRGS